MKRIITALLLFAAALLCACNYQNSDVEDSKIIMVSKSTDDDAKITSSPDSAVPTGQNPTIPHTRHITENKQLIKLLDEPLEHSAAQLDVEELLQYPELPTGCESVALTAVLRYHGFDLEKTSLRDFRKIVNYEIPKNSFAYRKFKADDFLIDYCLIQGKKVDIPYMSKYYERRNTTNTPSKKNFYAGGHYFLVYSKLFS